MPPRNTTTPTPAILTSPEHLLRDGHLQYIAGERDAGVSVVDTRSSLEHLYDRTAAEHLQDLVEVDGGGKGKG